MTQQLQDEFDSSVENAEAWMKAIHERLRIIDNTEGPLSALEARLRETEKICALEPEGNLKIDLIRGKADVALRNIPDRKCEVLSKVKDIKDLWEETATYITHCHSRIEWVWLLWTEYLKAQDEFYTWIHNMRVTLKPDVELPLGLKEKQWQLSHAQVLLNGVLNWSRLLETMLEEAASLFSRTGDPSVDEDVQKNLRAEYKTVRAEAQSRVKLLKKITKEHEQYSTNVNQFLSWLYDTTEALFRIAVETKPFAEDKLKTLKKIAKDIRRGEEKWKHLENQCAAVIQNTSPLGAERMKNELKELRKALEDLKLLSKEEERVLKIPQSDNAYEPQAKQLEADILDFRKDLERLKNDLNLREGEETEPEFVTLWRKRNARRAALAAERSKIEMPGDQLKELPPASQDVRSHAERVVSAIHCVIEERFEMITDTDTQLRSLFENLLQDFGQFKLLVQVLLETSEPALADIEAALAISSQFEEELLILQLKKDFLNGVLGEEKAKSFLEQVAEASKEREILHKSLLQSKSKLQDFDAGFMPLKKLSDSKAKLDLEKEPRPDLLGKKTSLQKLQTEEHVQNHWTYNDKLSDLQQWITVTTEKISSFQGADGEQNTKGRVADLERSLAEFPDKEIQLYLIEAYGLLIMENASPEESAHVQAELDQLKESWRSLKEMATGLLKKWRLKQPLADKKKMAFVDSRWMSGPALHLLDVNPNHKQERIEEGENTSSHLKLLHDFEEWLQGENTKLTKILAMTSFSTEEIKARQSMLEELQSHVADGQRLFETVFRLHPAIGNSEELEDLRYRWVLYKSKLKESMSLPSTGSLEEPEGIREKCSFLHRVCRAALPFQLLLLLLLLLAFLLPLAEETSCKLANNFAWSFNLMLRYKDPPPT